MVWPGTRRAWFFSPSPPWAGEMSRYETAGAIDQQLGTGVTDPLAPKSCPVQAPVPARRWNSLHTRDGIETTGEQQVEPGDVLIVGEKEELVLSLAAYDRRVLGVVSGACGYKPGLILDSTDEMGRAPVALMGKVFCKVDASKHPIEVGDMLTTSDRRGFAMKAADPTRAFGAVLGRALRGLASGQDLIPVLVALQ